MGLFCLGNKCMLAYNGASIRRTCTNRYSADHSARRIMAVLPNDTYGLDCFLYGESILVYDVKGTLTIEPPFFDDILLYERSSGNMIWYEPLIHDPTLNFPRCNADVWSPNNEYFVLARAAVLDFPSFTPQMFSNCSILKMQVSEALYLWEVLEYARS